MQERLIPAAEGEATRTTTWYNSFTHPAGYPSNFWAGASFVAINAATGASYGSGVVTASTSNTGSTGITFTLSPALSAACNPSQNDVLIVRLTAKNTLLAPNKLRRCAREQLGYERYFSSFNQHHPESGDADQLRADL